MSEFTEAAYRELVRSARARYDFRLFADALDMTAGMLWRHDIDMSVHRAHALARIERDEGVRATYFVYLHSTFYNALEPDVASLLRDIVALGHEIGLHFDSQFHRLAAGDTSDVERAVTAERDVLERVLDVRVSALSFHDPDVAGFTSLPSNRIAGLVNAYGPAIRDGFTYCSDSNGYWRFTPLADVLASDAKKLHVLTHPEWWVPESMAPRDRVARAIDGRARATARRYDAALKAMGRDNRRQ